MEQFEIKRFLGIFVLVNNLRCYAGTVRLFTRNGPCVYFYHNEVGQKREGSEWANRRIWNFYLFAIHHITEGKSTATPGWHVTWFEMAFNRVYRGFTFRWNFAAVYQLPERVKKGYHSRDNHSRT